MKLDVACVEDHEPDAVLMRAALDGSTHMFVGEFYRALDLRSLEQLSSEQSFDVLLLDLGLPDSVGLTTIARARAIVQATPLVVITGDEASGLDAIAAGADDFVGKDDIGSGYLARTLAHVVERHRLQIRLARSESERELERIGSVNGPGVPVASALVGSQRLRDSDPGFARHCEETFARVVFDRLVSNHTGPEVGNNRLIHTLSRQMAARNAGPDDIVAVLTGAVESRRGQLRPAQFGPFVRECRLALIEMMGHLLAHYRAHVPLRDLDDSGDESIDESVREATVIGIGSGRSDFEGGDGPSGSGDSA
jgi:CheY-like chemotaxis protein